MRIVVVADVYPPEISSAANLMQELAEGLATRGHEVTVATAYPRHYLKEGAVLKLPLSSVERGVRVLRIKTLPLHKNNFIVRGVAQLALPFVFSWHLYREIKKADAAVVYSPPLPLAFVGWFLKKRFGARVLLNLQDIFPQNAVDLGIMKNPIVIGFFEILEYFAYRAVDVLTFHSPGGRKFLMERKKIRAEKIATLPNWIDLEPFKNAKNTGEFRERYGLKDKFVILFAGILGPAQGLDFLLDVAEKTQDLDRLVYLLVGDGTEKQKLKEIAENKKLNNVKFEGFVSKEEYADLVKEMDIGLVSLSSKNKTPFIPGKFLGYLAAGKPVLAFLNKESDGFELVKKAQCGEAVVSGEVDAAEKAVRDMFGSHKLGEEGGNGLRYAEDNLSLEKILAKVEDLLRP